MDRRDSMGLSGSGSYFIQRIQPELQAAPPIRPVPNSNLQFQPNIGSGSLGSALPLESPAGISPHGVNVGAPLGEPVKRKRGRPRKYGPDGTVSLTIPLSSSSHPGTVSPNQKRGRGRPLGSGKKQQLDSFGSLLSGSAGMGFTPHVIAVATGEDVATKIMAFAQQGPRAICILSATGAVSTVTLHQPSTSGGSITYQGHYEILCLSGSYLLADGGNSRNRAGGINVSLASHDGRVIGGGVGGMLIAASPVQVIVGSFMWGGRRTKHKNREAQEVAVDSEDHHHHHHHHQAIQNPVSVSGVQQTENLTPTSSLGGGWPASHPIDMRNSHADIDLMRG